MKIKQSTPPGFTLIEIVLYLGIFSLVMTAVVQGYWLVRRAEEKAAIQSELNENVAAALQIMTQTVREADTISLNSVFNSHPGQLETIKNGMTNRIETATEQVPWGTGTISIARLKLTEGQNQSLNLTSGHVSVASFTVIPEPNALSPRAVTLNLTLISPNPGGDPRYDGQNSATATATLRKEIE